jgi:hypothetical protein
MKRCNVCFDEKPLTEFYTNGKQSSGKQKFKPLCIPCEENNRRVFVEGKRRILSEIFGDGCSICGYSRCSTALEFHHVDASVKEQTPSKLINNYSTIERMLEEVNKCVLVCSNCHREIHAGLLKVSAQPSKLMRSVRF